MKKGAGDGEGESGREQKEHAIECGVSSFAGGQKREVSAR